MGPTRSWCDWRFCFHRFPLVRKLLLWTPRWNILMKSWSIRAHRKFSMPIFVAKQPLRGCFNYKLRGWEKLNLGKFLCNVMPSIMLISLVNLKQFTWLEVSIQWDCSTMGPVWAIKKIMVHAVTTSIFFCSFFLLFFFTCWLSQALAFKKRGDYERTMWAGMKLLGMQKACYHLGVGLTVQSQFWCEFWRNLIWCVLLINQNFVFE